MFKKKSTSVHICTYLGSETQVGKHSMAYMNRKSQINLGYNMKLDYDMMATKGKEVNLREKIESCIGKMANFSLN